MINLLQINRIYLVFFIIILIIFYSNKIISSENTILFKINDKAFTSLDYELRKRYLDFVGNNEKLSREIIFEDFISANIFFEYYNKSNDRYNYDIKVEEIFDNIIDVNKRNNKKYNYKINQDNILMNIKIDFIRKTILERILNSNIQNLNEEKEEIDLLYKFTINYINIRKDKSNKLIDEILNDKNIKVDKIISFLNNRKIEFFTKRQEINNIYKIDKRIRDNILENKKFFIIENNNKITLIYIDKRFETLDGIVANIYSVRSKEDLDNENLKCENLLVNKDINIINKEYKFTDLNDELKNNLISKNDFIKYINNDENIYIILCDIKFDRETLNNINLNKIINLNVNDIENKFIQKYSKIFNLIKLNE